MFDGQFSATDLASRLIDLAAFVKPFNDLIDEYKVDIREFGAETYTLPDGEVKVSNASVAKAVGTELVLNAIVFDELPASMKAQLIKKGVVETKTKFSKAASAAVKITPKK